MGEKNKIAVVYLSWLPYGPGYLEAFADSYLQHPAGAAHELIILFNGAPEQQVLQDYHQVLQKKGIDYTSLRLPDGQDIDAYFYAARELDAELVLFLNTYSVILYDQWLKKYLDTFGSPTVALTGATASNQSYYSTVFSQHPFHWEAAKGWRYNYRKYKLFIKTWLYWSFLFKPFPNPHIRTNAFMVRRELFLNLYKGPIRSKFRAYVFENGRKGLTNLLLQKGYTVVLIDKFGRQYTVDKWRSSNTYWNSEQENLLVSDNQTIKYAAASPDEKKHYQFLAWGKQY